MLNSLLVWVGVSFVFVAVFSKKLNFCLLTMLNYFWQFYYAHCLTVHLSILKLFCSYAKKKKPQLWKLGIIFTTKNILIFALSILRSAKFYLPHQHQYQNPYLKQPSSPSWKTSLALPLVPCNQFWSLANSVSTYSYNDYI